jgi:hypothetical protein
MIDMGKPGPGPGERPAGELAEVEVVRDVRDAGGVGGGAVHVSVHGGTRRVRVRGCVGMGCCMGWLALLGLLVLVGLVRLIKAIWVWL